MTAASGPTADPRPCTSVQPVDKHPNRMENVAGFLRDWAAPPQPPPRFVLHRNRYGNVNDSGVPGRYSAGDLYPGHPQWREALEPGVAPLVDAVVESWAAVTYDSCAGHLYPDLELPPAPRRVGLLPVSKKDVRRLAAALCRMRTAVASDLPDSCRLTCAAVPLDCETSGAAHPAFDLVLEPTAGLSWPLYSSRLDEATDVVRTAILADDASPDRPCACPR